MGSGIRALQKHVEGDNRLWTWVMEPSASKASCLAHRLLRLDWVSHISNKEDRREIHLVFGEVSDSLTCEVMVKDSADGDDMASVCSCSGQV